MKEKTFIFLEFDALFANPKTIRPTALRYLNDETKCKNEDKWIIPITAYNADDYLSMQELAKEQGFDFDVAFVDYGATVLVNNCRVSELRGDYIRFQQNEFNAALTILFKQPNLTYSSYLFNLFDELKFVFDEFEFITYPHSNHIKQFNVKSKCLKGSQLSELEDIDINNLAYLELKYENLTSDEILKELNGIKHFKELWAVYKKENSIIMMPFIHDKRFVLKFFKAKYVEKYRVGIGSSLDDLRFGFLCDSFQWVTNVKVNAETLFDSEWFPRGGKQIFTDQALKEILTKDDYA